MQQQNQINAQKLKFRIISCSSEDIDYPVQELLTQSPQSKGWQTARFCDYPQEITLQFISPIRLKQVQFLSHQSKIASKAELFVYLPDPNTPYQSSDIKYKKLGYLSLDSNERTNFQARELKSVYVDAPCLFLKLLFHKNHLNKYNIFNQVGLIAISIFGEILSNNPEIIRQVQQQTSAKDQFYNDISYQTQFDPTTLDRLRQLELAKQQALREEDFEECKRIKEAIDRLKQIGIQLRQLDERKAIAIQNEDYDSARIIKAEIDRLRNAVAPDNLGQQQMVNQQRMQARQQVDEQQRFNNPESKPSIQQQSQGQFKQSQQNLQPMSNAQSQQQFEEDKQNIQPAEENIQDNQQDQQTQQQQQQSQSNRQTIKQQLNVTHDDQVIPTLQNKKQDNMMAEQQQEQAQQSEQKQAEDISNEMKKFADPLIPILTLDCCKSIFSKNWQIREEGLKWLDQEVRNPKSIKNDDPQQMFTAVMGAISSTVGDKIVQVSLASMQILKSICSSRLPNVTATKGDLMGYIDNIMATLIEKIGDSNQRLKEQAEQCLSICGSCPVIGNTNVVNAISKGTNLKQKFQNSHKHLAARNYILESFVKKYSINNKDVPLAPVMEFAVKCLLHPNSEVRTNSTNLIVAIQRNIGDAPLQPFLANLPSSNKQLLDQEFSGTANQPKSKQTDDKNERQTVISTNIQHQGQNKSKLPGGQQKKKQIEENLEQSTLSIKNKSKLKDNPSSKTCEFCGKVNKDFQDSQQLDIHLWKECPMLTTCKECAQVIDVANFANHLLKECESQKLYKKCPRCKEPIKQAEYQQHTQDMTCLPAKAENVANRCPLCHTDIQPGQNGWKKHLTVDQCPNNERTVQ